LDSADRGLLVLHLVGVVLPHPRQAYRGEKDHEERDVGDLESVVPQDLRMSIKVPGKDRPNRGGLR